MGVSNSLRVGQKWVYNASDGLDYVCTIVNRDSFKVTVEWEEGNVMSFSENLSVNIILDSMRLKEDIIFESELFEV